MKTLIEWHTIPFKKTAGKEKLRCPACDLDRSDKRDKSLSVNHDNGLAKCHYCNAVSIRDKRESQDVDYKLPSQDWKNYTQLSDQMAKYLESRKIPQSVAIELGWTEENHYQPAHGKKVNNLVYNFFEGETVVNKKYRSGDKKFTQSADGKPILYNINAAIGESEIYIVEGEMDVAALYAIGIKNAVSVPNGANDNDNYWINSKQYLEDVDRFIIAVDNDEKGIDLREKMAHRLGKWRCEFIEWEGKDANDDLISGVLEQSVKKRKKFPVAGTATFSDLKAQVIDLYNNGLPKTIAPKSREFGRFSEVFSLLRGQLTVATGIPSHGKSEFTDWLVLNLVKDYDMKASWFSPEHKDDHFMARFVEKVAGKNMWAKYKGEECPRISLEEFDLFEKWSDQKIFLTQVSDEDATWEWLLDRFREQMFAYGVDIFVIDAFNKLTMPKGNDLQNIRNVLSQLTKFAQVYDVLIFLVAHPTKMKKKDDGTYEIPTLYDVSGSADFRNMTHNGYSVYRYMPNEETGDKGKTVVINNKTKFAYQGEIGGVVEFQFNPINKRFYTDHPDNTSWLEPRQSPVLKNYYEPEHDLEDRVPF